MQATQHVSLTWRSAGMLKAKDFPRVLGRSRNYPPEVRDFSLDIMGGDSFELCFCIPKRPRAPLGSPRIFPSTP